ncbi:MAG: hypothetical protein ABR532_01665 [Candidatus Dormibacteria bacterium]
MTRADLRREVDKFPGLAERGLGTPFVRAARPVVDLIHQPVGRAP